MRSRVSVRVAAAGWRRVAHVAARTKRWATLAARAAQAPAGEIVVLLTDDETLRDLNHTFRGKNRPTNVLAFPANDDARETLGDIAIALGVAAAEARAAGKTLPDHLAHLVIHGVLHLAGHDHVRPGEAKAMERLEVELLRGLGIADPYRSAA